MSRSSIAMDSTGRLYVADRRNNPYSNSSIRTEPTWTNGPHFGTS